MEKQVIVRCHFGKLSALFRPLAFTQLVLKYYPPGNVIGKFKNNVFSDAGAGAGG